MMSKKKEFFITLLASFYFGIIFPIFVGYFLQGGIDWVHIPVNCLLGTVVGTIFCTIVPIGRFSAMISMKVYCKKPGTFLFMAVRYIYMVAMLLLVLMPVFITFNGVVFAGAPAMAVLPHCYDLYPYVFIIAYIAALVGDKPIEFFATKLAKESWPPMPMNLPENAQK